MTETNIDKSINVFGEPLATCGENPVTGYFRDGCCNTNDQDSGYHTVCILVSQKFLEYSRFKGNDLSTPMPEFGFPGLKPGDRWCLCASRWLEAHNENMAPKVYLTKTHERSLEIIPLAIMREYAVDLN